MLLVLECRLSCFSFVRDSLDSYCPSSGCGRTLNSKTVPYERLWWTYCSAQGCKHQIWDMVMVKALGSFPAWPSLLNLLRGITISGGAGMPLVENFLFRSWQALQILCCSLSRQWLISFCESTAASVSGKGKMIIKLACCGLRLMSFLLCGKNSFV